LVEDIFTARLQQHIWQTPLERVEVLSARVDDSGYDVVLESGNVIRHVQIKTRDSRSPNRIFKVNTALAGKPSGCVIVLDNDESDLSISAMRFFGGEPGKPLPSLGEFNVAKHTKGNRKGEKAERPNIRVVPIARFRRIASIAEMAVALFGERAKGGR
jgi:hypothetical protein